MEQAHAGGRDTLAALKADEWELLWQGGKERGAAEAMNASGAEGAVVGAIEVRPLTSVRELDACVALQVAVWGYADGDVIPRRVFVVANHIGGQVFGAMVDGALAGFAMALPGVREEEVYLHSHMLAVLPQYRNARLGRRLKLAQRVDALERGFRVMEWTFDPLEIKNAYFNLHRLGATCARYEEDFYGPSSSPLQGGLPTDRFVRAVGAGVSACGAVARRRGAGGECDGAGAGPCRHS